MKFSNWINFKYGKLRRGDECLYASLPAIYMGSYRDEEEDEAWNHMFLVTTTPGAEPSLISSANLTNIITKKRKKQELPNQMTLL